MSDDINMTVAQISALHFFRLCNNGASHSEYSAARHAPITVDNLTSLGMLKMTPDRKGTKIWRITGVGRTALEKIGR